MVITIFDITDNKSNKVGSGNSNISSKHRGHQCGNQWQQLQKLYQQWQLDKRARMSCPRRLYAIFMAYWCSRLFYITNPLLDVMIEFGHSDGGSTKSSTTMQTCMETMILSLRLLHWQTGPWRLSILSDSGYFKLIMSSGTLLRKLSTVDIHVAAVREVGISVCVAGD